MMSRMIMISIYIPAGPFFAARVYTMNTGYIVVALLYLILATAKSGIADGAFSLKTEVVIYGAVAVAYLVMSAE